MEQGILPSRKELLSRIELVCDLDSSLISVTGDSGIGKSALLEFFIEHHCRQLKKCFVGAEPDIAPYQVRESILSQLLPGSTFDSHLSLAQNLAALAPDQSFSGIFILDNAQYVADEVFYDLIDLMDDSRYQFSVIYAQPRDDSRQADLNARKALIEIHPEPLDVAESKLLMQFYFGDMSGVDKSQVKAFVSESQGIPASLLQWQQDGAGASKKAQKKAKKTVKKDNRKAPISASADGKDNSSKGGSGSKLMLIVGGGFLITVVAVAAWYFKPPSQQDIREQLRAKVEQQSQVADEPASVSGDGVANAKQPQDAGLASDKASDKAADAVNTAEQSDSNEQQSDDQQSNLAEQPTNLDELLAQPWDDNREIKPEHKFDSPEDKNAKDPKVIEVIKVGAATEQKAENKVLDKAVPETAVPEKTAAKQSAAKQPPESESTNKLMDNEWFLAQAATGAMVQLAGLSEKRVLARYLQRHQLKDSAKIYQSIRNGKAWYVVTLGPFANMNEARTAIGQLSQTLQDSRPWAKSIKAIQSEIINAYN